MPPPLPPGAGNAAACAMRAPNGGAYSRYAAREEGRCAFMRPAAPRGRAVEKDVGIMQGAPVD